MMVWCMGRFILRRNLLLGIFGRMKLCRGFEGGYRRMV